MGKKTYSLTWKSMAGVALLALALVLAPAAAAQGESSNSITIVINNLSQNQIVIEGAMLTQGVWAQGMQPVPQTVCPGSATLGPFETMSAEMGQGNGGELILNVGGIAWQMPWGGKAQIQVNMSNPNLQAQTTELSPTPGSQHVRYVINIMSQ